MGFKAKLVARHMNYDIGQTVYMKAEAWKYSTPTLYAILDPNTGKKLDYVNANEFKNRFKVMATEY